MEENSSDIDNITYQAWAKTIDVQMHFNDISMKIRNLFISIISALLAFAGVVVVNFEDPYSTFYGIRIHSSLFVLIVAVSSTYLFYFVDRYWYHQLLVGSVKHALAIEQRFTAKYPGFALASTIGNNSPIDVSNRYLLYILGRILGGDSRVKKDKKIHSDAKIAIFYKSIAYANIILVTLISLLGGVCLTQANPNTPIDSCNQVVGTPTESTE